MKVIIKKSYAEICNKTANYIKNQILIFNPTKNKPFVLGLPTGSTPLGVYKEFINFYQTGKLSFKYVITFNMDEYVGLEKTHPQSYSYFMYENLFNHIDIPPENINLLDGISSNIEKQCEDYEKKIKSMGGINLFLCGLGTDGHVAFNEPGSSLSSITRMKTLCLDTIEDNARFFDNDISKVPTHALTVGIKTILDSKEIVLLVSGRKKALALKMIIEEPISCFWTASALQNHNRYTILCDEESSRELKVKTYKYFKNLQLVTDLNGKPLGNCVKKYIFNDDKILITSPHPDDDIIGCGGILQRFPNKENVKVLYMSNGTGGLRTRDDRIKEALSALIVLGYNKNNMEYKKFPFYSNKERQVTATDSNLFLEYIKMYKPNHIFVCGDKDPNGTHEKCYNIIKSTKLPEFVKKIWIYKGAWETWADRYELKHNTEIHLNQEILDKKILALRLHQSQHPLKVNDNSGKDLIDRCIKITSDSNNNIVERFKIINGNEFISL
jgi:glucosamine-6-phosphate deaminase